MSMPRSWVDALFVRLSTRYGAAFMRQYEGADPESVKDDWQFVLSRCTPEMIRYGLEYLPADKPPNVSQFAMICNRAPTVEVQALPGPPPDPARVAELIGRMKAATEHGPSYCAQRIEEIANERRLTPFQKKALDECRRVDDVAPVDGMFRPIPESVLPPGMRT